MSPQERFYAHIMKGRGIGPLMEHAIIRNVVAMICGGNLSCPLCCVTYCIPRRDIGLGLVNLSLILTLIPGTGTPGTCR